MSDSLEIHLRDLGEPLIAAWQREFADVPSVQVSCGDIFSTKTGQIGVGDAIDVTADAIVSPANSFGFMDGGIDAVYTSQFGEGLQHRLQAVIEQNFGGELPVGTAVIVPTMNEAIPWCISAPTMRVPQDVAASVNAYLAFRAALRAVLVHNASGLRRINTVLCPGSALQSGTCPSRGALGKCASRGNGCLVMRAGRHDPCELPPTTRSSFSVKSLPFGQACRRRSDLVATSSAQEPGLKSPRGGTSRSQRERASR